MKPCSDHCPRCGDCLTCYGMLACRDGGEHERPASDEAPRNEYVFKLARGAPGAR